MYRISGRLLSGKNDEKSTPICQRADTPEDVIKFVGTLNASNIRHLEISEYDDEEFVECLSYADFLKNYEQQKIGEMFWQFEKALKEFPDVVDETIESLTLVIEEAQASMAESAERAIAAIKEVALE